MFGNIKMNMFGNIKKQRKIIESTYEDKCNIYNFEKIIKGSISKNEKLMAYENVPCALSQKSLHPTEQTANENSINYEIKLFISPEIKIKAGAEIEVIHCGNTNIFNQTGEAFVYQTHQEVMLKRQSRA